MDVLSFYYILVSLNLWSDVLSLLTNYGTLQCSKQGVVQIVGGGIFGNLISGVKISGDEIPPRSSALTNDIYSSFIYDKITQSYIMHI